MKPTSNDAVPVPTRARFSPGPTHGQERWAALLAALDSLLLQRPLAEISVSDIASAAGLNRSSFYFYFASKSAAVGALLDETVEELVVVGDPRGYSGDLGPREWLQRSVAGGMATWKKHAGLIVAMFDARPSDEEITGLSQDWLSPVRDRIVELIGEERAAGRAPDGYSAEALAIALVGMLVALMQLVARATQQDEPLPPDLQEATIEVMYRALYG